jgi:hypothetical protein
MVNVVLDEASRSQAASNWPSETLKFGAAR